MTTLTIVIDSKKYPKKLKAAMMANKHFSKEELFSLIEDEKIHLTQLSFDIPVSSMHIDRHRKRSINITAI